MSTPSAFGFLAGLGARQRYYSQLDHDAQLAAEKDKNEGTVKMLESLLNRDDVPVETKNAAVQSLMEFSKVPGVANSKHRTAAIEPVVTAFNTPRPSPSVNSLQSRSTDALNLPPEQVGDDISNLNTPLDQAKRQVRSNAFTSLAGDQPKISGFLTGPEIAQRRGNAFKTEMDALSGSGVGGGGGTTNHLNVMPRMDSKGGLGFTTRIITPQQKNYFVNGQPIFGIFDGSRIHDRYGNDITDHIDSVAGPQGSRWVLSQGEDGNPEYHAIPSLSAATAAGPKVPVRQRLLPTEDAEGNIGTVAVDPFTGKPGAAISRGRRTNSDVHRESIAAGNIIKQGTYKTTIDPNAFPGVPTPPGQPTLQNDEGVDVPVGTRMYTATKEPGQVLTRGSAARSVVAQGNDIATMVEDPNNAELFGKVAGRWNELLVSGPKAFALKWIGPVGTNDPRLASLYAGLKSISDLLTTVHGRRAEEAAANFEKTLAMVDSPQALAAAIRQYTKVAEQVNRESKRPTTKVNLSSPKATSTATPTATHRYIPGQGIVPVVPTRSPSPNP